MAFFTPRARAQDAATQAQLDQVNATLQNLTEMQGEQDKRISALEKKISDMQDKAGSQPAGDYASSDDLKKLAEQVQEIDKKRQEDNQKILDALEKLGHGGQSHRSADVNPPDNQTGNSTGQTADTTTTQNAGGPQQGYEYTIQAGNTLSAIAKAYRAKGIKVSVDEILKANPGLNANSLIVGKKIFIPQPQ